MPSEYPSLAEWRLCDECCAQLDTQLSQQAAGVIAIAWCQHRGIHAAWLDGRVMLQPCASIEQAQRLKAGYDMFARQSPQLRAACERVMGAANAPRAVPPLTILGSN